MRGSGFIFGETICGVIERAERADVDAGELKAHVTAHIAAWKSPRDVVVVDSIARAAHDTVDYQRLRELGIERGRRA